MRNSQAIENMERETGIEPATSSLGNSISIQNKKLMRRKRRILSTQVYEGIDRTFPRFRNRSNRSNNKLPQDCLESPHGMPAKWLDVSEGMEAYLHMPT